MLVYINQLTFSLSDADGVDDAKDNCLFKINPDQLDTDKDGKGESKFRQLLADTLPACLNCSLSLSGGSRRSKSPQL